MTIIGSVTTQDISLVQPVAGVQNEEVAIGHTEITVDELIIASNTGNYSYIDYEDAKITAINNDNYEVLEWLVNNKNNPNRDYSDLVLLAITNNNSRMVRLLVDIGIYNQVDKITKPMVVVMEYLFRQDVMLFRYNITGVYIAIMSGLLPRAQLLIRTLNTITVNERNIG